MKQKLLRGYKVAMCTVMVFASGMIFGYHFSGVETIKASNKELSSKVQEQRRELRCYVYSCETLLDSISVWNPAFIDTVAETDTFWDYCESSKIVDRPIQRPLELDSLVR